MEAVLTHYDVVLDMNVLCVLLAQEHPRGLDELLHSLVDRVQWTKGGGNVAQIFARRAPETVLLVAGPEGKGVWHFLTRLREIDPHVPCIVLVPDEASALAVSGLCPCISLLRFPQQRSLLADSLALACEQSRRWRGLQEDLRLQRVALERMPTPVLLVEHPCRTVAHANKSAKDLGFDSGAQCLPELLPDIFYNPPWEGKGGLASGFLRGVSCCGRHWDIFATWLPNGLLLLAATDVSGRVRVEKELQHSEKRLLGLVNNSSVGLYLATPEGSFLMANKALARMLGYEGPEQLVNEVRSLDAQIYVQEGRRQEMLDTLKKGAPVRDWISEVYGHDGDILWVQESLEPMFDGTGKLSGYEGSVLDVTERRYAEQGYRSALSMLRRTLDSISDIMVLIDLDSHVVLCNDSFAHEFSQAKEGIAGAPLEAFLLDASFDHDKPPLTQCLGSTRQHSLLLMGAATGRKYLTSMSPFQDETGSVVGAILIARNFDSFSSLIINVATQET